MQNIPLTPVTSSQIAAIGHNSDTNTLRVQFTTKKPDAKGSVYDYQNIDAEMFKAFLAAESKGKFFNTRIKPNREQFPYTKVQPAE